MDQTLVWVLLVGVGLLIFFLCQKDSYGGPLYLRLYEGQDEYQEMPSIWPVVDTATTARFAIMREIENSDPDPLL